MRAPHLVALLLGPACGKPTLDPGPSDGGATATDGGTGDGGSTGPDGGDPDTGGGTDGGGTSDGGASAVAPVALSMDAWCYPHTTGKTDAIWIVSLSYTDPQGDDTAARFFPGVEVERGGSVVATYDLVCAEPALCSGSFRQSQDGVSCDEAESWLLHGTVQDEDGNRSDPLSVRGRRCATSAGC